MTTGDPDPSRPSLSRADRLGPPWTTPTLGSALPRGPGPEERRTAAGRALTSSTSERKTGVKHAEVVTARLVQDERGLLRLAG
jgi:hypothetical protein